MNFDIRFLNLLKGFTDFKQHRDTKVAYYLTVSQEKNDSFRLTDLAYELTDMGGYDKPLEEFFKTYIDAHNQRERERVQLEKAEQDNQIKAYQATHKGSIANARKALGLTVPKAEPLISEIDGGKLNYDWVPLEVLHPYASGDADCTLRIHNKLYENIQTRPEWVQLFTEFYPRLTVALALTEANGMYMDREYMEEASRKYTEEAEILKVELDNHPAVSSLKELWQDLYEAGLEEMNKPPAERDKDIAKFRNKYRDKLKEGFNPGSSEDKGRLLYQVMGYYPPAERDFLTTGANDRGISGDQVTWEDYSTSRTTIEWIMEHYPESKELCGLMLDYAKVNTINNTFVSGLLDRITDPRGDGYIHGNLNSAGTECVSGDTLLITDKGIIPIEELSDMRDERTFEDIDIKVHSINGEERADGFYHNGVRDGLKITLAEGTEIITSKNHPIMSSTHFKEGVHINNHQASYSKQVEENTWREAGDLVVGDYVMLKPGTEMYGDIVELDYNTSKYAPTATSHTKQAVLPREMTEDLGLWLGMYMADGSLSKNSGSVVLTLTNSDLSILEVYKELTDKLFNLKATIRYPENRTSYVYFSSKHVGNWLCDLFKLSSRSEMKDVPSQVLQAPKQVQVAFIKGLTLDTATESRGYHSLTFSSVSKPLMVKLRTMLLNMGVITRISKCKGYKVGAQPIYKVPVTYGNLDKFMEDIGVLQITKEHRIAHKKANEPVRRKRHRRMQGVLEADTHILVKVISVEPVSDVRLYDLHVPGSHSFVGNGVMNHNTSRLSSSNPNLQNFPSNVFDVARIDYRYPVKRGFISRFDNGAIIQLDYSSLEMRILGLVAQDEEMTQGFLDGEDAHSTTASLVYEVPVDEVTKEMRQNAKAVSFGKLLCRLN